MPVPFPATALLCLSLLPGCMLFAAHDPPVALPGAQAAARLVKDLNPAGVPVDFQKTSELVPLGEVAYFLGGSGDWYAREVGLWVTDGSAVGTRCVRSFHSTRDHRGASNLTAAGGRLYFLAYDGGPELRLWTSDGTPQGTAPVPSVGRGSFELNGPVPLGDRVCFLTYPSEGERRAELWASDGTGAGTRRLQVFASPWGSTASGLTAAGGKLYFRGTADDSGDELWTSDGTAGGTRMVEDIFPGPWGSSVSNLTPWGERVCFTAAPRDYGGGELWVSDGTEAGTYQVPGTPSVQYDYMPLFPSARYLFFWAYTSVQPPGLWRTDGREDGVVFLGKLDVPWGDPHSWAELTAGSILFNAYDPDHGYELWRSDGTPDGTLRVADLMPGLGSSFPYDLTAWHGRIYFGAQGAWTGTGLWASDGTPEGTVRLEVEPVGPTSPDQLQAWRGRLWFMAGGGAYGVEPWTSDGTAEGTRRFADLAPDVGSSAFSLLVPWADGGALLGTGRYGTVPFQFWTSDGSPEGTRAYYTFDPEATPYPPGPMAFRGDLVLFPIRSAAQGDELWSTDGTEEGTRVVRDIIPGPTGSLDRGSDRGAFLGNNFFFSASNGPDGLEPWATDGTEAGTRMVADLCTVPGAGNPTASSWPGDFVSRPGLLFFTARGDGGNACWYASDGTGPGTRLLTSLGVESNKLDIRPPAAAGDTAFLFTREEWGPQWDLWASDGTPAGSGWVDSLFAGDAGEGTWWTPGPLFAFGDRVYFQAAPWDGVELWTSDGTSGGTGLLKDIDLGAGSSWPADFASLGDRFYFRADDGVHGAELWASDGTEAGTAMLADLCPGLCSGYPEGLTTDGDRIVFSATDGVHGHELWTTDGTPEGTGMAADLRPGPGSSAPEQFTPSGPAVYFTADDGRTGRELWRLDPTVSDP